MRLLVDLSSIPIAENWDTGLVRYALGILRGFKELGYTDVTLFVTENKIRRFQEAFPEFEVIGFKRFPRIPVLSKPFPRNFLDSLKWKRIINRAGCDLVYRPFLGKQFDIWKLKVPFILTVHDLQIYRTTPFTNAFITKHLAYPRLVRQAKGIIAISDYVKKDLLSFFKDVPEDKVTVIHNGVVLPEKEEPLPESCNVPYILTVNSLVPYKNVITLIKAFDTLKDVIPHKLVIVGKETKHCKKVLRKYVTDNGLEGRVVMTGRVSEESLYGLYRHADLFVTTSLMEGFGYTPVEAAIAGTKVISTTETALPESTMGLLNYYEPATDTDALAGKILKVLEQDDKAKRESVSTIFRNEYDPVKKAEEVYAFLKKAAI